MTKETQHKKPAGRPLAHACLQDAPMDTYAVRLTAWHARHGRKICGADPSLSDGVRKLIEDYVLRNLTGGGT